MVVLFLILALIVFVLLRAACFKPRKSSNIECEEITFDKDRAVKSLAELIKCRTVSRYDHELEDNEEFDKLISLLPELYPEVYKTCMLTTFPDRGLLFKWKGKDEGEPAVFMAHYDVVPVDENMWEHDPFSADIIDGYMWGRGTLDTKNSMNGILTAADTLISQGFTPKNDIYFAFSGGEEIGGLGAKHIADYLYSSIEEFKLILDEGGAVTNGVFPGVDEMLGLVGIAEKGVMNMKFSCKTNGGHASAPSAHTPVGKLSEACVNIEKHPFKGDLILPTSELFDTLGRYTNFAYRIVFANLWLFKPILLYITKKTGGDLNAMFRTTVAFTQMSGSDAPNVIPPESSMIANIRMFPGDKSELVVKKLKKLIKENEIDVDVLSCLEPSSVSKTDCAGWEYIKSSIEQTWKGTTVTPYLMVQGTDSIYYSHFSDRVYRFSAFDAAWEERAGIHGNNEKIKIKTIHSSVEFFIRVMKKC